MRAKLRTSSAGTARLVSPLLLPVALIADQQNHAFGTDRLARLGQPVEAVLVALAVGEVEGQDGHDGAFEATP